MSNFTHRKGGISTIGGMGIGRLALYCGSNNPAAGSNAVIYCPIPYMDYKFVGGAALLTVTVAPGAGDLVNVVGNNLADDTDNTSISGSFSINAATTLTYYIFSTKAGQHGSYNQGGGAGAAFAATGTAVTLTAPGIHSLYANTNLPTTNRSCGIKFNTTGIATTEDIALEAWLVIDPANPQVTL